jgi:hypothetical protein
MVKSLPGECLERSSKSCRYHPHMPAISVLRPIVILGSTFPKVVTESPEAAHVIRIANQIIWVLYPNRRAHRPWNRAVKPQHLLNGDGSQDIQPTLCALVEMPPPRHNPDQRTGSQEAAQRTGALGSPLLAAFASKLTHRPGNESARQTLSMDNTIWSCQPWPR